MALIIARAIQDLLVKEKLAKIRRKWKIIANSRIFAPPPIDKGSANSLFNFH